MYINKVLTDIDYFLRPCIGWQMLVEIYMLLQKNKLYTKNCIIFTIYIETVAFIILIILILSYTFTSFYTLQATICC